MAGDNGVGELPKFAPIGQQLIVPIYCRDKNPIWFNETPNERYVLNPYYEGLSNEFARINSISNPGKFFEVRIISGKTSIFIHDRDKWWNTNLFMDKVFWVYQRPIAIPLTEGKTYLLYALELYECQRVMQSIWEKHHRIPKQITSKYPSLAVPVECVQQCFWEFKAGESENKRPREDIPLTQQQVDQDAATDALANKIEETIQEVEIRLGDPSRGRKEEWKIKK